MSFQISAKAKFLCHLLLVLLCALLFLTVDGLCFSSPSLAAHKITVRYLFFARSLPIEDLRTYAETAKASPALQGFLNYIGTEEQKAVQQFLQVKIPLDIVALNKLLDTEIGKKFLSEAAKITANRDKVEIEALRTAVIDASQAPEGLGVVSFLESYPSERITINLPQANKFATTFLAMPEGRQGDNLSFTPLWQLEVEYQAIATSGKQYSGCLFGDSISAGVGNTLGNNTSNLALNGLSAISLVEQLTILNTANLRCQKAIVAIGANDAMYGINSNLFVKKMTEAIDLVRATGAKEVFLIPAFYSTVAASLDPNIAGSFPRVNEINALIRQVALAEKLPIETEGIQPLFKEQVLQHNLTVDGVHLNDAGLKIYRQALLKILNPAVETAPF